ncbi:TPA: MarR family winged helix-turn-helix transcriptional regulator [Pseudomonas aeruginosa]
MGGVWRHVAQTALLPYRISLLNSTALLAIAQLGEGTSQRELAEAIGVDTAIVARIINELTASGLVQRRVGDFDQRVRTLWFTEVGRLLPQEIDAALRKARAQILAQVDDRDLETALRVFHLMERAVWSVPGCVVVY